MARTHGRAGNLAATRDFVRARVVPRESEIMDKDELPSDIRAAAADLGLFGYAIPQEWGGLGAEHGPGRGTGNGIRLHVP
jgi:alkylation response protein AidB-like acyl-CoA dehydrogenase